MTAASKTAESTFILGTIVLMALPFLEALLGGF